MLKAVRFDPEDHKELLAFILAFKDDKGKKNESEAMRYLMTKGLEGLNKPLVIEPIIPAPQFDYEKMKSELLQELIAQVGVPNHVLKPQVQTKNELVLQPEISQTRNVEEKLTNAHNPVKETANTPSNPLLANLLNNKRR